LSAGPRLQLRGRWGRQWPKTSRHRECVRATNLAACAAVSGDCPCTKIWIARCVRMLGTNKVATPCEHWFASRPVSTHRPLWRPGKGGWVMPRTSAERWLSERTRTGLREMPSNAAWLLSRLLQPAEAVGTAAESAAAGARDRGRRMNVAVADITPLGEDSVDVRMKRARDAAERAREAEERVVRAAQESKERSDHAREVGERGRARVTEVERETTQRVKERVAEAQKAAERAVERERQAAEADAEDARQAVRSEVDAEIEQAQFFAEASRQEVEGFVAEATEKLATARRLADEATEAARAVAAEAHRRAQQLAVEAEHQASEAEARIEAAEQVRGHSVATAKETARELQRDPTNGGLESYNKPELVELAASIGIEGRTEMTKAELVDAIARASRTTA
jgi:colicin import membrane protein